MENFSSANSKMMEKLPTFPQEPSKRWKKNRWTPSESIYTFFQENEKYTKRTVPFVHVLRCQFFYAAQHRVCTWNTRMWTLERHILQIQVEVFHAVAATAENGEDGPYYLAL
jgi:hypothetical protein